MLEILNSAFSYVSAPASRPSLARASHVQCSMVEKDEATTLRKTDYPRERLLLQTVDDQELKLGNGVGQAQVTTGLLDQLLQVDELITSSIGFYAHPKTQFQHIVKKGCKILEISGHGLLWFGISGLLLFVASLNARDNYFYGHGLNIFFVLAMDLLVVAPIKMVFKRPRPHLNIGMIPLSVSRVDEYAFPSGHTSRCIALAAYFCYTPPFNPWTHLWYIWGILVSLSRVALGRHHVLDVGAGIVAGLIVFDIVRRSDLLLEV